MTPELKRAWRDYLYLFNRSIIDELGRAHLIEEERAIFREYIRGMRYDFLFVLSFASGVRQTMLCLLYYIALKVMASRFASEVGELIESLKEVALRAQKSALFLSIPYWRWV